MHKSAVVTAVSRPRRLVLSAALLLALAARPPSVQAAGRLHLQSVSRSSDAVRRDGPPAQLTASERSERAPVVQLEGRLSYDARSGLTLAGTPVFLDARTGIFPITTDDPVERMADLRAFNGKVVSLFGRRLARGVRATLIIEQTNDTSGVRSRLSSPPTDVKPSDSDPNVGEVLPSAPR